MWKTTKLRSQFRLKDKVTHVSNVIYKGEYSCGDIGINKGIIIEKQVKYKGGMNIMAECITDITCVEIW